MAWRVKPAYWITGGLVLALIAGIALFDWNMVKPYAERQLSDASGRTVSLAGNLNVKLALSPRVHVDQVRISNPPWAREKDMLVADAVDVTIDLGRLLRGQYYLPDVVLTHPKLALEIGPDGRHNWYLDPEQKDSKSALQVGRLQVDAGDVVFHDPAKKTEIHA
ncbi:MAG TPA: AsmA family protein, partial [Gallionella sp.]|nr:AsmA family protein [Gallionella sp.]